MPSPLHDTIVDLLRQRPDLVTEWLQSQLNVALPAWTHVEVREATMGDLITAEYRADLVILLVAGVPVFAFVVEVQLSIDREKAYRWLSYVATVRDRWRCPTALVVVAPDVAVARWAREPIPFGGTGSVLVPLVLGPDEVPVVRRGDGASPEAAVLSALAHPRGPGAYEAAIAAIERSIGLDEGTRAFYTDLILSRLEDATRVALEALMQSPGYEYQSSFARRYFADGKAEGKAEGEANSTRLLLLELLTARQLVPTPQERRHLDATTDAEQLRRWFSRAISATTTDEVFDDT